MVRPKRRRLLLFWGITGNLRDKALVVPDFNDAAARFSERLEDDFLVVGAFGDFDAGDGAVRADGVDAIGVHEATSELWFQRSLSGAGSGVEISGDFERVP